MKILLLYILIVLTKRFCQNELAREILKLSDTRHRSSRARVLFRFFVSTIVFGAGALIFLRATPNTHRLKKNI